MLLILLVFCVVSAHDESTNVHPRLFVGIRAAHLFVFCVVSAHDTSTKVHPRLFGGIRVAHLFSFLCC